MVISEKEDTLVKRDNELRTACIEVAVTPEEKEELSRAAKSEGMGTSTFMRIAALQMARGTAS